MTVLEAPLEYSPFTPELVAPVAVRIKQTSLFAVLVLFDLENIYGAW